MREPVFAPKDVLALSADPEAYAAFVPWGDAPLLLIEAHGDTLSADENARLSAWLFDLPCVSVAILGDASRSPWLDACDAVIAGDDAVLPTMVQGVERHPLAAASFVQLLRRTHQQPLDAALAAESQCYAMLQAGPEYGAWLAAHRRRAAHHADEGPAVLVGRDGDVMRLSLNRPSRGNAMSVEMRDALLQALRLAVQDAGIAQVLIDGRGACFSTGGDLDEFGTVPDVVTGHLVRSLALPGRALAALGARASVTVHGACVGSGIEFPAFAAELLARDDAHFRLPELGFGLIPGAGGCVSIPRRIGRQRTVRMVLSGETIDADTAVAWGLVDAVV